MLQLEITESEQEILVDALNGFRVAKEQERKRNSDNTNNLSNEAVDKLDEFYDDKISAIRVLSNRIDNMTEKVM